MKLKRSSLTALTLLCACTSPAPNVADDASRAAQAVAASAATPSTPVPSAPTNTASAAPPAAPEAGSGWTDKPGWRARKQMVVAAHPLASEAGLRMMRAGGSAVDAAIAAQMVLTLVEPQSSGIGGGAFMMHFDGRAVEAWDGRETAPQAVNGNLFIDEAGQPLEFYRAIVGGRAVGTPGVLRMLEAAHRRHGRLKWKTLFAPAIELAERGFPVGPRLATLLRGERHLMRDATARAYFYRADGSPLPAGTLLRNPELAQTLRRIADGGADAFYRGQVARDIVAKVGAHADNPGRLTLSDFAAYRAKQRKPVCVPYRRWEVCGMPPPSSGGIAVGQMLGILGHFDVAAAPPSAASNNAAQDNTQTPNLGLQPDPQFAHWFAEAGRLAFADRLQFVGDSDFAPLPGGSPAALLAPGYLRGRAALIGTRSLGRAEPGEPLGQPVTRAPSIEPEMASTSHVVAIDARGHAVSMTTSIEDQFGSRMMVDGFLLNNQLSDFSFAPRGADGALLANRVEPGKRPRSSMSPVLVFARNEQTDKGKGGRGPLLLALGSPGGSAIINYVARALVARLDWGMDLQQALAMPNFGSRNGPTEVEAGRTSPALIDALKTRGHEVKTVALTSGLHAIERLPDGTLYGAADPRREGEARGD